MNTFKICVAYDGTDFVGWQRQAAGTSIQGLIEGALRLLDGRDVTVTGAGRTDAGVHALAQAASFALQREIDPGVLVRALNARLPETIRVASAKAVAATFNARFDARTKTYRYRIWNGPIISPFERLYAWHVVCPLDETAMAEAAELLEGRHDFAAFQGAGSDVATTVRTMMRSRIVAPGERQDAGRQTGERLIIYEATGDGFLRHMVRNIAGTLVEVGRGRRTPASIREIMAGRDRSAAGVTAPARGLFLAAVEYGACG